MTDKDRIKQLEAMVVGLRSGLMDAFKTMYGNKPYVALAALTDSDDLGRKILNEARAESFDYAAGMIGWYKYSVSFSTESIESLGQSSDDNFEGLKRLYEAKAKALREDK